MCLTDCDLHRLNIDPRCALCSQLKRGLISTPPSDMLPTAEGGKANAWLRQKNAGIYVRPRLFSPYVEEAKVRLINFRQSSDMHTKTFNAAMDTCHFIK